MPRVSPADIEAARANVGIYAAHVRLKRVGDWLVGCCPLHDDHEPSFGVKGNHWQCFAGCGKGDTIEFLRMLRQLDFVAAVQELAGRASEPSPRAAHRVNLSSGRSQERRLVSPARPRDARPAHAGGSIAPAEGRESLGPYIASLWRGADHPELAELYLASRGIILRPKPLPAAIRGHHRVRCTDDHGKYRPAVLAAVSEPSGAIVALQRIWCERTLISENGHSPEKGTRATDLSAPKKTIGPMGAGAVRLAEPGHTLGLAEGVESALSASLLFRLPVWATLGAQRLGQIELPDVVKSVVIFGDSGAAGEKAASAAITAYRRRGYQCDAVFPERGSDFNEQLMLR